MNTLPLLLVLAAGAQPATPPATAPAALHVGLRRMLELERPAVTAAYPVDPELVSVSVAPGRVRIYGVRPGSTRVVLVAADGLETILVAVDAPPPRVPLLGSAAAASRGSSFQAAFDSQTSRFTTDLDAVSRTESRTLRLRASSASFTGGAASLENGTSLPWLAFAVETPRRALVLGDERSEVSPLTLSGAALRGLHWSSGRLLLHAGWSSAALYEDLLLPSEREAAAGASYRLRRGGSTLMPSVYVFPSDSPYGGSRGALGTLLYSFGAAHERLRGEAEIGYGGQAVAAGALTYLGPATQGRIAARRQPAGTASLGLGRPHGTFLEGDLSRRLGGGTTVAASFNLDHNQAQGFEHRSEAASAELRFEPGRHFRLRAGARVGSFEPSGGAPGASTVTLPVELSWSAAHASVSGLYRHQRDSGAAAGHGGRVNGQLRFSRLRASAYVDWQPSAASVDLALDAEPGLSRALAELGLRAQTPDELARLLRDNALLLDLGYFDPASIRFDAVRRQAGFDLAWSPGRKSRLAARLLLDRTSLGEAVRTTRIATLGYSHELAGFELFGSVSLYSRHGATSNSEPSFRIGLRRSFDGMPSLPRSGGGALTGRVFRDDQAAGRPGERAVGVAGAEVRLDDGRYTLTDASGRFRFDGAGRRPRRVELAQPSGAYFTTPSAVDAVAGREALFGVAYSPARLSGRVRDDAGNGIAGVRLRISAPGAEELATSDSLGGFAFSLAPGEYGLALVADSLPPGFALTAVPDRTVRLARNAPAREEFELAAQRSLSGRVISARPAQCLVCLREEARCVTPDGQGRFAFRGVGAGRRTLVASDGPRAHERAVVVGAAPGAIAGLDLEPR